MGTAKAPRTPRGEQSEEPKAVEYGSGSSDRSRPLMDAFGALVNRLYPGARLAERARSGLSSRRRAGSGRRRDKFGRFMRSSPRS